MFQRIWPSEAEKLPKTTNYYVQRQDGSGHSKCPVTENGASIIDRLRGDYPVYNAARFAVDLVIKRSSNEV